MRIVRARFVAAIVLLTMSAAAHADDYSLDDVAIVTSLATYRARHVDVVGAALSRDDALKLLAVGGASSAAEGLAKIDAARISIPELVSETRAGDFAQTTVYHDVAIERVAHGVADSVAAAGLTIESRRGAETAKGRFGALHAEGVDFPAAARMTLEQRTSPDQPKQQIMATLSLLDIRIDVPDGGGLAVDRLTGRNFGGRPLAASMSGLVELAPRPGQPPDARTQQAVAAMISDLLASIDIGALEMDGLQIKTGAAADNSEAPGAMKARHVALAGVADGKVASFTMEGIDSAGPADAFHIDRIALSGFDARPAFAADVGAGARAAPHFDHAEIAGASIAADGAPVSIGAITVDARDWMDLTPTSLVARAEHIVTSLTGAGVRRSPQLAALGYDRLDLSAALDLNLDRDKHELSLNDLSLRDDAVGGVRLSGVFGHVSPDLFSGVEDRMRNALLSIVVWRAALRLENRGALDRYVDALAKANGMTPAVMRGKLAATARAMALALFTTRPDPRADVVAQAASAFVDGARTFDLSLAAPQGVGAIDLMMAGQLGVLMDKLKIDANAK